MNKRELRSEYRRVRHGLMPRLNASLIQSVLAHLNDQKRPHRQGAIGITWPLPGEPDLRLLAELQAPPLRCLQPQRTTASLITIGTTPHHP